MNGKSMMRFRWWHEAVLVVLLALIFAAASQLMPKFLQLHSQLHLSRHLWEMAILSLGMTAIIISGGIDLSVGSTMGLSAVAFGICFDRTGSIPLSIAACLTTGCLCGAVNGTLVSKLDVHPLIVTLATYAAFRGIADGVSQGESYSQFGDGFAMLARGKWFDIPIPGYLFAFLAIFAAVYLTMTPGGRFIYAMGHNDQACRFSGVDVGRIRFWLYTTSGALSGLAGLIYVSRFNTAKSDAGLGFELDVITAVVVGGTSIFGGKGNIGGTILGLLLVHETRLFVGRYWRIDELKSILVGCLLIASILIYRLLASNDRSKS